MPARHCQPKDIYFIIYFLLLSELFRRKKESIYKHALLHHWATSPHTWHPKSLFCTIQMYTFSLSPFKCEMSAHSMFFGIFLMLIFEVEIRVCAQISFESKEWDDFFLGECVTLCSLSFGVRKRSLPHLRTPINYCYLKYLNEFIELQIANVFEMEIDFRLIWMFFPSIFSVDASIHHLQEQNFIVNCRFGTLNSVTRFKCFRFSLIILIFFIKCIEFDQMQKLKCYERFCGSKCKMKCFRCLWMGIISNPKRLNLCHRIQIFGSQRIVRNLCIITKRIIQAVMLSVCSESKHIQILHD